MDSKDAVLFAQQFKVVISVVMINRNGARVLGPVLHRIREELTAGISAGYGVEFVFVDNGSTDQSVTVVSACLEGSSFGWRIVVENEGGVNYARNAGVKAASGELLLFVDNDVHIRDGWLLAYIDAAKSFPECEVFGGRVLVGAIEGEVPNWLDINGRYRRPSIVIQFDAGTRCYVQRICSELGIGPVGPSMGFRRSIFDRYGLFDTGFGLRPGSLVAGAEAEYFDRLERGGETFVYVPDAMVEHPVRAEQLSKSYFLRRLHGSGRVHGRLQRIRRIPAKRFCGITLYLFEEIGRAWVKYAMTAFSGDPKKRFFYRCNIAILMGHLHEDVSEAWRTIKERLTVHFVGDSPRMAD